MIKESPAISRQLARRELNSDLAIVGGGIAGVCCAITAARAGLKVILIQDRPVLGGNASSEVRLWILGATSHMGNNNRWAREGGVMDEILVENMYRNPEGNPIILDTLLLELVTAEPNIQLLLNTAVHDLEKSAPDTIRSLNAFCSQNSTSYHVAAPLFVDASGDGIVGFLAGAAFRIGVEARAEFGELFAPEKAHNEILGHTIYFYSKDTGRPVKFFPPAYALKDISKIPRWRDIKSGDYGCRLWWLEWGGKLDTIHDCETIKWELWKVAYGVWHHVKNSGQFPEAMNYTLEWVGTIPGKRESRRFEGDYMLTQQDIVEQRQHPDAVSFGGWAIDLHPPEGVYSSSPGCVQWHSKGVFQIPYRCLYSRNISNLFLAGRIISSSHVAFGSTRVMATCGHNAQAVAIAATICRRENLKPGELLGPAHMAHLQRDLLRAGQFIPGVTLQDSDDLAPQASITASSELKLAGLAPSGETLPLTESWGMMLPLNAGPMPAVEFTLDVTANTVLNAELRQSSRPDNHTPDVTLARLEKPLPAGASQRVSLQFAATIDTPRYVFVCLHRNEAIAVHLSDQRVTGVLSVCHAVNKAVAKSAVQTPPPGIGIDTFEFWLPRRRPNGKNLAIKIDPPIDLFQAANLVNGIGRPTRSPHAWVADFADEQPVVKLTWPEPKAIRRLELWFDTDFDHPMESVLMGHPERLMPLCVTRLSVFDSGQSLLEPSRTAARASQGGASQWENGPGKRKDTVTRTLLAEITENHQSRQVLQFDTPVTTDCLEIAMVAAGTHVPAALFAIRCYS